MRLRIQTRWATLLVGLFAALQGCQSLSPSPLRTAAFQAKIPPNVVSYPTVLANNSNFKTVSAIAAHDELRVVQASSLAADATTGDSFRVASTLVAPSAALCSHGFPCSRERCRLN